MLDTNGWPLCQFAALSPREMAATIEAIEYQKQREKDAHKTT